MHGRLLLVGFGSARRAATLASNCGTRIALLTLPKFAFRRRLRFPQWVRKTLLFLYFYGSTRLATALGLFTDQTFSITDSGGARRTVSTEAAAVTAASPPSSSLQPPARPLPVLVRGGSSASLSSSSSSSSRPSRPSVLPPTHTGSSHYVEAPPTPMNKGCLSDGRPLEQCYICERVESVTGLPVWLKKQGPGKNEVWHRIANLLRAEVCYPFNCSPEIKLP